MNIWYALIKSIFRIYMLVFIRKVKVTGRENLIDGPKILVANHPNMTDSFVLPFILQEDLTFLIQAKTFSLPVIGWLLSKSGQIPVIKGQGRIALDKALEQLSQGNTVVIYPEGRLNHGKGLCRVGSGAAVLAKRSGTPIVPMGFYVSPRDTLILKGKIHNKKTFARWQVRGCCHVHIGEPWSVTESAEQNIPRLRLRAITKRMMAQVADLVQKAHDEAEAGHKHIGMQPQIPQTTQ
jgi:1-acyl-sn-glycerol-3-phosphate acyltransferase